MRCFLKKYMPSLVSGLLIGYSMSFSFLTLFYAILLGILILLIYVEPDYNIMVYKKAISLSIGIVVGTLLGKPEFLKLLEADIVISVVSLCPLWIPFFAAMVKISTIALIDAQRKANQLQEENIRPKVQWKENNLFAMREYDLDRLQNMVFDEAVCTIGLEAAWGQGKSFLVDGLLEIIDEKNSTDEEKVDVVRIDVMAIRMDKFPEHLVGELDNILYKNGRISNNSRKLRDLFKNANLDFLLNILGDATNSYNKIFDEFRNELLRLERMVLIIYEDIDRLGDKNAIRDILYLTEKLTSANDKVWRGGIKAIYQYDRENMESLGFSAKFLEKYIRRHMDLSVVDFRTMINKIQTKFKSSSRWEGVSEGIWLDDNDIMEFSFIRSRIDYWFPEEKTWIDRYLASSLTLRRATDFLASALEKLRDIKLNTKENRKCILAFYFIQYFLPLAYQRLKEAQDPNCPLWRVFCIQRENGKEIYFMERAKEINNKKRANISLTNYEELPQFVEDAFLRDIDYRRQPREFELFVAYRLLFAEENLTFDKEKAWNEGTKDEFYSASAAEVYKKEGLGYVNTEKMVRYLLQAGYAPVNSYVYWANAIVSEVLSCDDKSLLKEKFKDLLKEMRENERGVRTIQRLGTYLWPDVFRAFVFAGKTWNNQENEDNFVKLIELYEVYKSQRKDDKAATCFSKIFINETLPLWEGLQKGEPLRRFAELIVRQKVYCNWNQYVNFYCYIKAALTTMTVNTYWTCDDFRKLEEIEQKARDENWAICVKLTEEELDSVLNQLKNSRQILLKYKGKGYLPGEDERIKALIDLVEYFQKVMKHQTSGRGSTESPVRTEVHDIMAEAYAKAASIQDDEAFQKHINSLDNGIGIANSIKLIDNHETNRK